MNMTEGEQPCANFREKDELFPGSGNRHECYCPFEVGAPKCGRFVSSRQDEAGSQV